MTTTRTSTGASPAPVWIHEDDPAPGWADEVRALARQRDAVILAHSYQLPAVQDVADHVFLSASYFSKVFRDGTGQTPGEYITAVRVEAAKKLLRDPGVNLVEVSELVGFESQSYFTRVFKKATGGTPGKYRQQQLELEKSGE